MKYFIGQIEEINGEQDYTNLRFFKAESLDDAIADNAKEAGRWYTGDVVAEDDGFYFHGCQIFVCTGDVKEITKTTYDELYGF